RAGERLGNLRPDLADAGPGGDRDVPVGDAAAGNAGHCGGVDAGDAERVEGADDDAPAATDGIAHAGVEALDDDEWRGARLHRSRSLRDYDRRGYGNTDVAA